MIILINPLTYLQTNFWGAVVGGVLGLLGAKKSADATKDAANTQAEAVKEVNKANNAQADLFTPHYKKIINETGGVYDNRPGFRDPTQTHLDSLEGVRGAGDLAETTGFDISGGLKSAHDYYQGNLDGNDELLRSQIRDDERFLTEQQLPTINSAFARAGAAESGRRNITEDVAVRGFNDRVADVSAANKNIAASELSGIGATGIELASAGAGKKLLTDEELRSLALEEDTQDQRDLGILSGVQGQSPNNVVPNLPHVQPAYGTAISAGIKAGSQLQNSWDNRNGG